MTIDPVSLAITAALTATQMAMQASQKIEGPRLTDLTVTVADYGTPLNYLLGTRRFEGAPIMFAEPIREVKRRRKTKGGKFNDYTYFGTWAAVVADQEIAGVTRIWFDKHLVYDATNAGPVTPFAIADGFDITDAIRIYLGTETQEPDPRMEATVDAAQGVGSTPAYRGVSYIFFEDIPLEKLGNRIPQIAVEAVTAADAAFPHQTKDCTNRAANLFGFTFSPDFSYVAWGNSGPYEVWDVAARTQMIATDLAFDTYGSQTVFGLSNSGILYTLGARIGHPTDTDIYRYSADGLGGSSAVELATAGSFCQVVQDSTGVEYICVASYAADTTAQWVQVDDILVSSLDVGFIVTQYCADDAGNIWAFGGPYAPGSHSDVVNLFCISGSRAGTAASIAFTGTSSLPIVCAVHNGQGAFVVMHGSGSGGHLLLIDDQTLTVTSSAAITPLPDNAPKAFINCPPGATSIWLDNSEYSLADLSLIRTITPSSWGAVAGTLGTEKIYDPVNNAIISFGSFTDEITWLYLDRIASADITLQSVVEAVTDLVGLDLANIDASNLDQTITGYSWTQGSGKDILDPLLDAYDSIVRPHDFTLQFIKRGSSSGGTITTPYFVRQGDARYKVAIATDTDLPRRLTFTFADIAADQQSNAAVVQRPLESVDTTREASIDMTTLALGADDARQLAERWFRRQWFQRTGLNNALTMQQIGLEPGDVRTISLDGNSATYRLTATTIGADGVIGCNWKRDDPSVAVLSGATGAVMDGRAPTVISVPVFSKGFVLDIPLITDSHNSVNPLLYYGAGPYAAGSWPGAIIYQSVDGEYSDEWATVPSTAGLTWGYSTGVLPSVDPWVWDRGSSVNVVVKNGTLTSTTEAACDANATTNLALLGDELIQFTTGTLEVDGSYTLSGLKRGRRGTEWAVATHDTGDYFILLDQVGNVQMGTSDVGTDLSFKAATQSRDVDSAFPIPVEPFTGASLKPYAPALVNASKDAGTGDWTITWTRRSRIGGAWTSGTSVPLGEAAEEYEVDILNGSTVVRTISGLTTPTATYTAAQQTTDGGSVAVGDLDVAVYQISASVDRGFAAPASF